MECECGCGLLAPIAKQSRPERGVSKGQKMRFIKGHNAGPARFTRWSRTTMRYSDCHPDRKHFAFGLCRKCYGTKYYRDRKAKVPTVPCVRCGAMDWKPEGGGWRCGTCRIANNRKYRHGVTREQYEGMLNRQDGRCAICNSLPTTDRGHAGLAIDHSHTNGRVRGLLCLQCNTLLGNAKENVQTLKRAIEYLEQCL